MISRTLWPNDIACQTAEECLRACGAESGCTNVAYPTLVMRILPNGLKVYLSSELQTFLRSNRGQIRIKKIFLGIIICRDAFSTDVFIIINIQFGFNIIHNGYLSPF